MTLFRDYKKISRGSLTREGKEVTAEKLIKLVNDYPVVGLPVVRSLLQFKWVRKKVWSSELQNQALVILQGDLNQLSLRLSYCIPRGLDISEYPTMHELMELVVNRSSIAQAAIPATFKSVLQQLTSSQLQFIVSGSRSDNLRAFLNSNGIPVKAEDRHKNFDFSFAAIRNGFNEAIRSEIGKLDPAHTESNDLNEDYIAQVLLDINRYALMDHISQNNSTAQRILENFVVDEKEISSYLAEKERIENERRMKRGLKPSKIIPPPLKDRVKTAINAFIVARDKFSERIKSKDINIPILDKPVGRLSVGNESSQKPSFASQDKRRSVVELLSYDDFAKFVFAHQSVKLYWDVAILNAGASVTQWNPALPRFVSNFDTNYEYVTSNASDNTVAVRQVANFVNIDGDGDLVGKVRMQIEIISRFEMLISPERRGMLPRSFSLRRISHEIKAAYPGGSAFPDRERMIPIS